MRKPAIAALNDFIDNALRWSYEDRLLFARWVLQHRSHFRDDRVLIAEPLQNRFLLPTVEEWLLKEPESSPAHLWRGLLGSEDRADHLRRALALDPRCDLARKTLVEWILRNVKYNQHELPCGYLGDANADLESLQDAAGLILAGSDMAWIRHVTKELRALEANAQLHAKS